jgi:hypothetical protein
MLADAEHRLWRQRRVDSLACVARAIDPGAAGSPPGALGSPTRRGSYAATAKTLENQSSAVSERLSAFRFGDDGAGVRAAA